MQATARVDRDDHGWIFGTLAFVDRRGVGGHQHVQFTKPIGDGSAIEVDDELAIGGIDTIDLANIAVANGVEGSGAMSDEPGRRRRAFLEYRATGRTQPRWCLSLADVRAVFQRDFSEAILKRRSIKVVADARPGTVADLFDGYVQSLKAAGKPSWSDVEQTLGKAANILGRNLLARDISPQDVLGVLRPIYERGKPAMADHMRSYIRSAYSWGLKSELDYRSTSPRRFKLTSNPAADIPTEPKVAGTRWLDEEEFVQLYHWLECPDAPVHPPYTRAVRILMLTGQRVEEIARLHVDQWNAKERIIDWSKTKNGRPHAIPVPALATELIDSIVPNEYGWFFPSAKHASKPVRAGTLYSFMWRQRDRGVIPIVTNRDLRRTWKTLAGKAGISKEIRDRIQNHALHDVSSKNYDRWTYMPEKRAAMDKWNEFASGLLKKEAETVAA
jgi:integrase